ncbi:MAG: hypothetical protein ABSE82_08320 [Nitrososphaerales archaeon]|jgi:uncharacterized membrane protein YfcA
MAFDDPIVFIVLICFLVAAVFVLLAGTRKSPSASKADTTSVLGGKRNFAQSFFSGLTGIGRAFLIVAFAGVLALLTGNIVAGIGLAAIAMYVWMLNGEIEALEGRIRRLEEDRQKREQTM